MPAVAELESIESVEMAATAGAAIWKAEFIVSILRWEHAFRGLTRCLFPVVRAAGGE
jgi:hypothetical protein